MHICRSQSLTYVKRFELPYQTTKSTRYIHIHITGPDNRSILQFVLKDGSALSLSNLMISIWITLFFFSLITFKSTSKNDILFHFVHVQVWIIQTSAFIYIPGDWKLPSISAYYNWLSTSSATCFDDISASVEYLWIRGFQIL